MLTETMAHVVERIRQSRIETAPFTHIVVDDVFPKTFYDDILRNMMPDSDYRPLGDTGRVAKRYSRARLSYAPSRNAEETSPQKRFWDELFAALLSSSFTKLWVGLFRPQIVARLASDPELSKVMNDISFAPEMFLMRDIETYALGPHTDSARKAISILFYLPADDRHRVLGTSLYAPKAAGFKCPGGPHYSRDHFNLIRTVDFRPNRILAFPKTADCFHGVEPVPPGLRRDLFLLDIYLKRPPAPSA